MRNVKQIAVLACIAVSIAGCSSRNVAAAPNALMQHSTFARPHALWIPAPGTWWQWQLSTPPKVQPMDDTQMYDIDMFDNDAATVAKLHATGAKVVCYIDAGTWENWRPDAKKFPKSVLGEPNGWPGERYLDIRRIDILGPIMSARVDQCASKIFDGVEFDNVDTYQADSGFPLTASDQLTFNEYLAGLAHARGLSAALKNDPDQVTQLLPYFEFAVVEQCFQYSYCNKEVPFITAGKAVFETEYKWQPSQFCAKARALQFSAMQKHLSLDRWRLPCWN